tara:strand:- start:2908 stop:3387 length:480 start_codon:yes stop_codon:yes gene_type:complete
MEKNPTAKKKFGDPREMVGVALCIAERKHRNQFDRDGFPHLFHSMRLANQAPTPFLRALALLHDVPEDCTPDGEDRAITMKGLFIAYEWPDDMYLALVAITRQEEEKYEEYIKRVSGDDNARLVKILDLRDNLTRSVPPLERHKKRYEAALSFLTSVPL